MASRTCIIAMTGASGGPIPVESVQVDDQMVEHAARLLAEEFGYEFVFDGDQNDEGIYDAPYFRHIARKMLGVALTTASSEDES